jgi:DNA-directed RNA polymerase specialized sigma24 family protein
VELHEALEKMGPLRGPDDTERQQAACEVHSALVRLARPVIPGGPTVEDAREEAIQESLFRLIMNPPPPCPTNASARGYLRTILRSRWVDRLRKQKTVSKHEQIAEEKRPGPSTSSPIEVIASVPRVLADLREIAADADRLYPRAKPSVSERLEVLIDLYVDRSLTFEDYVAQQAGTPSANQRSRLQKSLLRARDYMLSALFSGVSAACPPDAPRCPRCDLPQRSEGCPICEPLLQDSTTGGESLYEDPERVQSASQVIERLHVHWERAEPSGGGS